MNLQIGYIQCCCLLLFAILLRCSFLVFSPILCSADGFVVQTGDPEGPAEGFIDPSTEKPRTIPLEITVVGEKAPVYGATLEVSYKSVPLVHVDVFVLV